MFRGAKLFSQNVRFFLTEPRRFPDAAGLPRPAAGSGATRGLALSPWSVFPHECCRYPLRVNHKKLAGASNPNRDQQFQHITALRERCAADNSPLISVDTKKKELVGTFRNPGAKWDRSPQRSPHFIT